MASIRKITMRKWGLGRSGSGSTKQDNESDDEIMLSSCHGFKHIKCIDGLERSEKRHQHKQKQQERCKSKEYNRRMKQLSLRQLLLFGAGRMTSEERLKRRERYQEDVLNRSEHDELSRPWRQHNGNNGHSGTCGPYKINKNGEWCRSTSSSFRTVKFIDEKDRAHHQNERHDLLSKRSSSYHSVYHRRHETMLEVMKRLKQEEAKQETKELKLKQEVNPGDTTSPPYLKEEEEEPSASDKQESNDSTSSRMLQVGMETIVMKPDTLKPFAAPSSPVVPYKSCYIHVSPVVLTCVSSSSNEPSQPAFVRKGYTAMSA